MSCEYKIVPGHCVVLSRASGTLTDADLLGHQKRMASDPRFSPAMNQLFDFQEVTMVELTTEAIMMLAGRNLFGAGSKRAFVVSPGAMDMYGMMRMFEILTDDYPDELRLQFNNLKEARCWLGLPEP